MAITWLGHKVETTTVCDCSNPTVKGIIDLSVPKYCDHAEPHRHKQPQKFEGYTIVTKKKDTFIFQGNVCEMWIKEKKITGSFWVGAYNTEFHEYTRYVSRHECRAMVETGLCGNNKMIQVGEALKYTEEPEGPGKWYDTRKYSTLNCAVTNITLSQEKNRGTIMSPLGEIDNLWYLGYEDFNHKMIIWDVIDRTNYEQFTSCRPTELIKGRGTVTFTEKHGRLIDTAHQLEILFDVEKKALCNLDGEETVGHTIFGLPDGYLVLRSPLEKKSRKRRSPWDLVEERTNELQDTYNTNSYSGVIFQYEHPFNYITHTGLNALLEVRTMKIAEGSKRNVSYEGWPGFSLKDQLLKIYGTDDCVVIPKNKRAIRVGSCDDDPTLWIYDEEDTVIIDSEYGNCLTRLGDIIGIAKCRELGQRENQTWLFWNTERIQETTIPIIFDFDRPNQMLPSLLEMASTEDTTVPKDYNSFAWGKITNFKNNLCIRVKGEASRLKMKSCTENSEDNKGWIQDFELMGDLTLRALGTDYCVTALHAGRVIHKRKYLRQEPEFAHLSKYEPFSVILEECRLSATRWVYEYETGQLIGFDFHTKMSLCLDRVGDGLEYLSIQACELKNQTLLNPERTQSWNLEFTNQNAKQSIEPALAKDKYALHAYLKELKRSQNSKYIKMEQIMRFGKEHRLKPKHADKGRKKRLDAERFSFLETQNQGAPVAEPYLQGPLEGGQSQDQEGSNQPVLSTTTEKSEASTIKPKPISTTKRVSSTTPRSNEFSSPTSEENDNKPDVEKDIELILGRTKNLIRSELKEAHEQYKIGYELDMSNLLADEIRQVYCEIASTKRRQLMLMAQISPLLAATGLGKNVSVCGRIEGRGETLIMQQCVPHKVEMKAILTRCGYEPIFAFGENNHSMTIGIDGWSMRNYTECFHNSHYIGMNGKTYYWHSRYDINNGNWLEKNATIHGSQAALVAGFDELMLNDEDFKLFAPNRNSRMELEKLNILMELANRDFDNQLNPNGVYGSFLERDNKLRNNPFGILSFRNVMQTIGMLIMIVISFSILIWVIKIVVNCLKNKSLHNLELGKKNKKETENNTEPPIDVYLPEPIINSIQERWYGIKGGRTGKSHPIEIKETKI